MRIPASGMFLVCALLALAPVADARAAGAVDERLDGPAVGAQVGALLAARDQTGKARDFRSLRGKKGLILLFSRSFDW